MIKTKSFSTWILQIIISLTVQALTEQYTTSAFLLTAAEQKLQHGQQDWECAEETPEDRDSHHSQDTGTRQWYRLQDQRRVSWETGAGGSQTRSCLGSTWCHGEIIISINQWSYYRIAKFKCNLNATLARQARQARASGGNLNYVTLAPQARPNGEIFNFSLSL